ncbi:MAG: isocitrate lyase [Deltaproteobacteria bacterium]|nr:isocitrate lyase [Deltaproteobacteria bacterium]
MKKIGQLEKEILTPEACAFLNTLHRKFHSQAQALVADRLEARRKLLSDENLNSIWPMQSYDSAVNANWKVAAIPEALSNRTVEITGPAEAKMIINALNCGANVFMADFEDSLSPTWEAVLSGHKAIAEAYKRTLRFQSGEKVYELNRSEAELATLKLRPRGWHLPEPRYLVDGQAGSATLFDFGLSLFHSGKTGVETGRGPFYYLPKLEGPLEARLWADVFEFSETALGLPRHSIRATVLIETLPAALAMEQILFELRSYIIGFNAGRWDYLFSIIKTVIGTKHEVIFPDRKFLTMDVPFMRRYAERIVDTCVRRGAQPIGGMSALIPNRRDGEQNARALEMVRKDKDREARQGFVGTWVAHPDLVPVAREAFEAVRAEKISELEWQRTDAPFVGSLLPRLDEEPFIVGGKLLPPTLAGVRLNIDVSLRYLAHWLGGLGAVAIHGLMEDAATAEISRSQLWQWRKHAAKLESGETVTADWLTQMIKEISGELLALIKNDSNSLSIAESDLKRAESLLHELVMQESFVSFLTLPAMDRLQNQSKENSNMQQEIFFDKKFDFARTAGELEKSWSTDPRWNGVKRPYSAAEVLKLQSRVNVQHTWAARGAARLWHDLNTRDYVHTMGAMTGGQAVQYAKAGLQALYLSGWQVAGDANLSGQTYPDQSLYPSNSVPAVVRRINNALTRMDQVERSEGKIDRDLFVPIVADAEAGFGGPLHAFELMKQMIEAGAAGVHFEDQLASEKKCGHLGGKVLVPTSTFVRTLTAARLAADVLDVPTLIIARTDSLGATLITSDIDPADRPFLTGERTSEGYYRVKPGMGAAIARGLAYAPYADLLWVETSTPDLKEAKDFADAIHKLHPGKVLAYNCSPSFNWKKNLDDKTIAKFQKELAAMGYKFQFITLAGWHLLNHHSFQLAEAYKERGMSAYVELQEEEFAAEGRGGGLGYTATRHQREVGTGYFDQVLMTATQGASATSALAHSTEAEQFGHGEAHV